MKHLLLAFSLCGFFVFAAMAQTTATAKKATPTVNVESVQDKADEGDGKKEKAACCKGKDAKDCCKGKKGDAKACAEKQEGLQTAEGNKVQSATGTKPACCAGKKQGTSCAGMKAESTTK